MKKQTFNFWRWLAGILPRKLVFFAALRVVAERINEDGVVEVNQAILPKLNHWQEYAFYEKAVWLHTIREHEKGDKKSAWRYWRNWLHLWTKTISWEVLLFPRRASCAVELEFNAYGEKDVQFHLALPFVLTIFLGFSGFIPTKILPHYMVKGFKSYHPHKGMIEHAPFRMPIPRSLGFRIFDNALWVSIWEDDTDSSHNKWWSRFVIRPDRILLGREKYSEVELSTTPATVELPEGAYPVTVTLFESTWKRARWPWPRKMIRARVDCGEQGIPGHAGKGENSWDLEDDSTYAMTCPETSVEDAVKRLTNSILSDRARYGEPTTLLKQRAEHHV